MYRSFSRRYRRLHMRILVIEDEPRIQAFVTRGLAAEGFTVEACSDGASGLERGLQESFDLVILDLLLPGIDGLTLLSEVRRKRPELPVLILSARSDLSTKLRGFELGARDYLSKPFSLDELLARVRVHLRRSGDNGDGNVIRVGTILLDLARRQASVEGEAVALSDREFRLLHHLMQHEGEVVSRERLLADVWGYDFDPRSNVVEVCMRRLRKKLGPNAPIETVRNAGYRLSAV
jgi:two-component system copper resistance phosphate regulon response regulator CusR